ncbi:MAG TPA: hypothetical protein VKJ45_08670 [Blastocatellia bacterium]|nr:hypothetical protein [Blastocatellia bacterium]
MKRANLAGFNLANRIDWSRRFQLCTLDRDRGPTPALLAKPMAKYAGAGERAPRYSMALSPILVKHFADFFLNLMKH